MIVPLIKILRPRQWIKNMFVAVPLFFAMKLTDPEALMTTGAAIFLFSMVSGCVYILNDILDIEKDRVHPKKCTRPLPSGELSVAAARTFAIICLPTVLTLGYLIEPTYALILAIYFTNNIAYSFKVKHIAYLDVLSISTGFMLRILAGAAALQVPVSPWLFVCGGLLAMFLGFGKRAHELGAASREQAKKQREVLAKYNANTLNLILQALAMVTVVSYVFYTRSEHVMEQFGTDQLAYTVVFPIIGILRFIHLATTRHESESPTEEMLRDPLFMLTFLAGVGVTTAILYGWL